MGMNTGLGSKGLLLMVLALTGSASISCATRSHATAGATARIEVARSKEWLGLARTVLDTLDWSRICDSGAVCRSVRVDSLLRRAVQLGSARSSETIVAVIHRSDLPERAVRYSLGDRERDDRGEDAVLTMVVRDQDDTTQPKLEVDVYLLRPRQDTVLVLVEAERRSGLWVVTAIKYLYS